MTALSVLLLIAAQIFFGGLSFHLNLAILAHMFSINMEWGATAKEAEASNFFKEMPKIFKSFKWMYLSVSTSVSGNSIQ